MDLLGRVREDFGIRLIGVRPTGLGADARAVLRRGETADGRGYAVKTSSAPQPGLVVADFLAARGVRGVPPPVRTSSGDLLTELPTTGDGGHRLSVVPWVEGVRAIDTGMDAAQWRGFGELLGAVHATLPAPPLVEEGAGRQGRDPSGLLPVDRHDPRAEVGRARVFGARLARCSAAASSDPLLEELSSLWAAHAHRVLEVATLAETTATSPGWENAPRVICHADPHHGNLVLGSAGSAAGGEGGHGAGADGAGADGAGADGGVWLVDWDDAVLAPREADLIFVVGGVYSFAPITPAEVDWFFQGYRPASGGVTRADLDETRLTHYRSTRALTDFLDFADDVLDLGRDSSQRASSLRIAAGALAPEGLVSLTLSEVAAAH